MLAALFWLMLETDKNELLRPPKGFSCRKEELLEFIEGFLGGPAPS
jgi:hypothetical protein